MNCSTVRTDLLASPDPTRLPAELAAHLANCPQCQVVQQRLLGIERLVPYVPVVGSGALAKADLLRRVLEEPTIRPALPAAWWSKVRPHWLAALAASVLGIAVLGRLSFDALHRPGPAPVAVAKVDALLASAVARHVQLGKGGSPTQRVLQLAGLAQDLDGPACSLARVASGDDLALLAQLYEKVIRQGLVKQAGNVPADSRALVLNPVAERLTRIGQDAATLALAVPPAARAPLERIAKAATDGEQKLRQLVQDAQAHRPNATDTVALHRGRS